VQPELDGDRFGQGRVVVLHRVLQQFVGDEADCAADLRLSKLAVGNRVVEREEGSDVVAEAVGRQPDVAPALLERDAAGPERQVERFGIPPVAYFDDPAEVFGHLGSPGMRSIIPRSGYGPVAWPGRAGGRLR